MRQLEWWAKQFTGLSLAEVSAERTGATVNRYIATLSHALSFAVKERRFLERNPVGDISRWIFPRPRRVTTSRSRTPQTIVRPHAHYSED